MKKDETKMTILKTGFSRLCITPTLKTSIAGYYKQRYTTGIVHNCISMFNKQKLLLIDKKRNSTKGCTKPKSSSYKEKFPPGKFLFICI